MLNTISKEQSFYLFCQEVSPPPEIYEMRRTSFVILSMHKKIALYKLSSGKPMIRSIEHTENRFKSIGYGYNCLGGY